MTAAGIWYLDTSAVTKLVRPEAETAALRRWLRARRWIVSDVHRTELRRAALRSGGRAAARADRLLAESEILTVTADVFDAAGRMTPPGLRSLDALHLAAATLLGPDLAGVVVYDDRLADAARHRGLTVVTPGTSRRRSARHPKPDGRNTLTR